MDAQATPDWDQVANLVTALSRPNLARFRDAALGGKNSRAVERRLLAEVARSVPDVTDLFVLGERFRVDAVRRLAAEPDLNQWIHCSPGFPSTAGLNDTHHIVLATNPNSKVLYVADDLVVASHSQALRQPDDDRKGDRVRVIRADIFRPREIRNHPNVDGWLDWSQPIVLIHGNAWIHYPGSNSQAADIMQRWIAELATGSYTISSHLQQPEPTAAAAHANHLEQMIATSPVNTIRFRSRTEIEALFPMQELANGFTNEKHTDPADDPAIDSAALRPWVISGIGCVTDSVPPGQFPPNQGRTDLV